MEIAKIKKHLQEESIKYAQQHLANERTYLAWIRTSISIIGVGFLTTSLHFTKISSNEHINILAIFIGIFACLVGFIIGVLSTVQYSKKRRQIQEGIFIPTNYSLIFVSAIFFFLIFLIIIYLSFLLLM